MPADLTDIGIQSHLDTTLTEISYERACEIDDVVQDSTSVPTQFHFANPTGPWTIKGSGAPSIAVAAIDADDITEITSGVSLVLSVTHTQANKTHDSFEVAGHHYPGAS